MNNESENPPRVENSWRVLGLKLKMLLNEKFTSKV
jgi:hypothetical protein